MAELVPVELALSEFSDLLKESLKDIIRYHSYLEIIVADSLFVEVSHLESSASLERLGLNYFLNLGRSVGLWRKNIALLATISESSFASCKTFSADRTKECFLSALVDREIFNELWKSECESSGEVIDGMSSAKSTSTTPLTRASICHIFMHISMLFSVNYAIFKLIH